VLARTWCRAQSVPNHLWRSVPLQILVSSCVMHGTRSAVLADAASDDDMPERYLPKLIKTSGALDGFDPVSKLVAKYEFDGSEKGRLDDEGFVLRRAHMPQTRSRCKVMSCEQA